MVVCIYGYVSYTYGYICMHMYRYKSVLHMYMYVNMFSYLSVNVVVEPLY